MDPPEGSTRGFFLGVEMRDMLNRAVVTTDRGAARAPAPRAISAAPLSMAMDAVRAHQGRGNASLYLADSVLRQARVTREDVAPDIENGDATVGDGSPEQEMEPLDPTIDERQMDEEEEPTDDEPTDDEEDNEEAGKSVEVIAIEVDTGDEEEVPAEEMAA